MAEHSRNFSVILKPGFAPLEQYKKKGEQGPWTDIYSLGATLYYALTGDIPDDPMTRLDDDDIFEENKYNINDELWAIIVKATMLKISDRYEDIFEMRRALNKVSFAPEPIFVPLPEKSAPEEGFRTAMPSGASASTIPQTVTIPQTEVTMRSEKADTEEKPVVFAKHKKQLIAAIGGSATVAAAAVIIAVALNSGGKQPPDGMIQNPDYSQSSFVPLNDSSYSSLPQKTTASTPAESDEKPVESEPEVKTSATTTTKSTPKPEVESKPEVTTPATTTTKSTPKPVESKPEEVKEITIKGETYSASLTKLNLNFIELTDSDVKDLKYMKNLTKLEL